MPSVQQQRSLDVVTNGVFLPPIIPHRVGYQVSVQGVYDIQCSNFYRQYILPKGLVIDPHYTITSNGEAIFHRKKSSVCQTTHQPKTR